MPTALPTLASMYQILRRNVVSAIGAHRNFHVCGMKLAAISAATCSTLRPCCVSNHATVTVR